MTNNRLIYLPLGGAGEIGMNAYVYGYGPEGAERLILVDLGVTFGDMDSAPGVDLILPDIAWLEARRDRLDGIFITHAHEDHVGALGHLWNRLKAPVFARRFTSAIARLKMEERGTDVAALTVVQPWPEMVEAGPFRVGFLPVSHSIPEASALVIDTPAGRIVHTGDFKLDGNPMVGEPFDPDLWHSVAKGGIKVLACDSTNVFTPHPGRSESILGPEIARLFSGATGMVATTTFASNVARVRTLAHAGRAAGRSVVLLGRAMKRMVTVAQETGVLTDFPPTVAPEEAHAIPRENLLLIVTGSQGERRAATAQLARGKYLGFEMKDGDTFLFSSKTIPGNERPVLKMVNAFSEVGVNVVDDDGGRYHVSGHANRPDLEAVHDLMKPAILIPMHGEHRHLREHVRIAQAKGMVAEIVPNGTMVDLTGDRPEIVEYIETGRLYLDGTTLVGALDGVIRDRIRMALNGHVMITLIIEDDALLGEAWAEVMGLPEQGRSRTPLAEVIEDAVTRAMDRADRRTLKDDDRIDEMVRKLVRQVALDEIGKKPEVTVVVSRLMAE
jgi:ribonuclease J